MATIKYFIGRFASTRATRATESKVLRKYSTGGVTFCGKPMRSGARGNEREIGNQRFIERAIPQRSATLVRRLRTASRSLSKITFALVSAVFCLLLLTNTAYSQTPSPITYLFVEVKDTSGKAIDDATVTVDGSVATKTNKDGFAEARFLRSNQRRYD
jgi:hypothetical protein